MVEATGLGFFLYRPVGWCFLRGMKYLSILMVGVTGMLVVGGCLQHTNDIPRDHEKLGYNYNRDLDFVYYRGERIDQTTPKDIEFLRSYLKRPLVTPANADCRSFEPLSEQYSKDKNRVYFRWIRGCLLYTSPSPRDLSTSRMPSSA